MYVFMPSVWLRLRRRAVLRNVEFESFWLAAEEADWAGSWDERVLEKRVEQKRSVEE